VLQLANETAGQSVLAMSARTEAFGIGRGLAGRRPSEAALIRAAQRGSSEAIEELFRRHWPRAHRAAWLVVRDAAAAEDIAQEAFLAGIRALDSFDRRRPFGPWVHRIVVNRAIDHARSRALRREVDVSAASALSAAPAPGVPFSRDVMAAMGDLSPEHRAVVALRYVLDFTPGEIAEAIGLPRGTVNSRLRRALDRLSDALEAER
jgi:RNA polymerase sigma-70 factor (ECF subfamily)